MHHGVIGAIAGETALVEGESMAISCSQFDIIYEKYCFELVSINRKNDAFHMWDSICVSTEPGM